LPQPLVRAFNWPEIKSRVTVDSVVTVVDAKAISQGRFADDEEAIAAQRAADPNVDHENPIQELFEDQLNCADMVILNKTDLIDGLELATVTKDLKTQMRMGSRLVPTQQGVIDAAILLGTKASAEDDLDNRKSNHEMEGVAQHDHDDFNTFIVELSATQNKDALLARIAKTIEKFEILRVKGFAAVEGSPARLLIQAVGPRMNSYFDRAWNKGEAQRTQLVVIGEKSMDQAAITAALMG
jgi:cobalamin biosynthesis protein CobW